MLAGMVAGMTPVVPVADTGPPITVGVAGKVPVGPDSCTLNWLPTPKAPDVENGTERLVAVPEQTLVTESVPVVMDCAKPLAANPIYRKEKKTKKQYV
ncbi:hypothetical protein GCM10023189_53400 [Nibrella saemangeumensis]|uniref:Uncharacterized protein n=1 Tax=Nibrella saemangeumensis TaxID=1084526 RepID=A0ABP8NN19_9BACT